MEKFGGHITRLQIINSCPVPFLCTLEHNMTNDPPLEPRTNVSLGPRKGAQVLRFIKPKNDQQCHTKVKLRPGRWHYMT